MQDMTPTGRNSIRNIPVSGGNHRRNAPKERFEDDIPLPRRRKRSKKFLWWTLGAVVVCALAGLLLSTLFEGATVTITPKTQQITPPANIIALPDAPDGSLGYQTVSLSQSATTTATASGTTHVSTSASGVITIYNAYSTASQALVTNTRFEAPDGKIYRIHSATTVPGATKNVDGTLTPGSVVVTVYADAAGADYNRTDPTTFTIPGFQGDPRYKAFSAQSTAPITGGFVGDQPAVSTADMQAAQLKLQSELDSSLRSSVTTQIPQGYLPVQGSLNVTYTDIAEAAGTGTTVSLSQSASATMAMIKSVDLAAILAKLLVTGYGGEAIDFGTPDPLVLQLASSTPNDTGPLTILLQGNPTLVWQFDQGALKTALLGKDKSTFQTTIETFAPAIEKAEASIRPFWKSTFPTDPSKLSIDIEQ